ncbi:MAG: hypothetical protein ACOX6D_10745 [Thermoguttaceae bacterium]|jgi:hypothetical protein
MTSAEKSYFSDHPVNPVSLLLTGFAFLFTGFLWFAFAAILLRHGHFRLAPFPFFPLILLALFLGVVSFGAHFFLAAHAEWNNYPYWLDERLQKKNAFLLSIPNILSAVLLLGWSLSGWNVAAVFLLAFLEIAARQLAPPRGERLGRFLRAQFGENNSADNSPEPNERSSLTSSLVFGREPSPSPDSSETIKLRPHDDYPDDIEEEKDEELPPPEDLLVTQNRCLNDDGTQRIEGWFRAAFRQEETVSVCHLSFCPPFRSQPRLQLFQISGDEVQINATMVEPFGARIEVKRDSAFGTPMTDPHQTEPEIDRSVRICFFADESAESARLTV